MAFISLLVDLADRLGDISEAASSLGVGDFAVAVFFFQLRLNSIWNIGSAFCSNLLFDYPFRKAKAVTERNRIFDFLDSNSYGEILFTKERLAASVIDRSASGCGAEDKGISLRNSEAALWF
jgi:hypothetical protein